MKKKAISAVIVMAMLVLVSLVSVISFQTWFNNFESSINVKIESDSKDSISGIGIENLIDHVLYVKSDSEENITLSKLSIEGVECSIDKNISKGITELNVIDCISNQVNSNLEIVLITDDKILQKNMYLKKKYSLIEDETEDWNSLNSSPMSYCNNPTYIFDQYYNTSSYCDDDTGGAVEINYSIPENLISAKWMYKIERAISFTTFGNPYAVCYNYSSLDYDALLFNYSVNGIYLKNVTIPNDCLLGSSLSFFVRLPSGFISGTKFYEETMFWNILN